MKRADQIEHKGTVAFIGRDFVLVAIEVNEACGSCASRKACAMGTGETREVKVLTSDAATYRVGEAVRVGVRRSLGAVAVVLCYVVPLVVMIAALAVALAFGVSEGLSAVASLAAVALYYGVLWLLRNHLSSRISLTISKL